MNIDKAIEILLQNNNYFLDKLELVNSESSFYKVTLDINSNDHMIKQIIHQPNIFAIKLSSTIQKAVNKRNFSPQKKYIFTVLKPSCIPSIDEFKINCTRDLIMKTMLNSYNLSVIENCQIISLSEPYKYKFVLLFYCSNCKIYRVYQLLYQDYDKFCPDCHSQLEEKISSRIVIFKQDAYIKKLDCIDRKKNSHGFFPTLINFLQLDDDTDFKKIKLGSCFSKIYGISTKKIKSNGDIESIFQTLSFVFKDQIDKFSLTLNINEIPKQFIFLNNKIKAPWTMIGLLAHYFCEEISPNSNYFNLKLGLLLSLLSSKDLKEPSRSSLICFEGSSFMIRSLFSAAARFATTTFVHLSKMPLFPTLRKASTNCPFSYWIDSGTLSLSSQGVCIIGSDIKDLTDKDKIGIITALDSGKMFIKISGKEIRDVELPVDCSLWAFSITNPQDFKEKDRSFIDLFSISYHNHKSLEMNFEYPIINISQKDWVQYLNVMSSYYPEITSLAKYFLKGYYIGVNKIREVYCSSFTFEWILSIARSLAKLSLSNYITQWHAIISIIICEDDYKLRFGSFSLFRCPSEGIKTALLGPENIEILKMWRIELLDFIKNYCDLPCPYPEDCEIED